MLQNLRYFTSSIWLTLAGLAGAWAIAGLEGLWIAMVLAVLEVSLSFDNAVVNAKILKDMDALWRHRFITWGMAIAVFGMRYAFPLIIVAIALSISPWAALSLAIYEPEHYAHALESVHVSVMGFGGTFLLMVALKFFIDHDKEVHWLEGVEEQLTRLGKIEAIQAAIVMTLVYGTSKVIGNLHVETEAMSFLTASIWGLISYILVDGVEAIIGTDEGEITGAVAKQGLAAFLYLEVLDASFSFDGVLGALALTNNIFIMAIGLGIGAMFVRSLTLLMVDKGTVDQFIFMEAGAFWAILGLGIIMFINTIYEIPETVTGLIGAAFIAASIFSSVKYNRVNGSIADESV
jgi:hypothetical protein